MPSSVRYFRTLLDRIRVGLIRAVPNSAGMPTRAWGVGTYLRTGLPKSRSPREIYQKYEFCGGAVEEPPVSVCVGLCATGIASRLPPVQR